MTKDREFWRYTFAGQIYAANLGFNLNGSIEQADFLISKLEASAPAPDPFEQARKYPCVHGMHYLKGRETCQYNCFGDWPLVVKECEHEWLFQEAFERGEIDYSICYKCRGIKWGDEYKEQPECKEHLWYSPPGECYTQCLKCDGWYK